MISGRQDVLEKPIRLADLLYGTDDLAEDRTNTDEQYNSVDSAGRSSTEESLEGDADDTSNSGTTGQFEYREDGQEDSGDESRLEKGDFPLHTHKTKPRRGMHAHRTF